MSLIKRKTSLCFCGPCLRMRARRGLILAAGIALNLFELHLLGVI